LKKNKIKLPAPHLLLSVAIAILSIWNGSSTHKSSVAASGTPLDFAAQGVAAVGNLISQQPIVHASDGEDDTPVVIEPGKDGNPDKAVLVTSDNQKIVVYLVAFSDQNNPKFFLINQFGPDGNFAVGSNMRCSDVDPANGYHGTSTSDLAIWSALPKAYQVKVVETCAGPTL
jgi:hypothetical protein